MVSTSSNFMIHPYITYITKNEVFLGTQVSNCARCPRVLKLKFNLLPQNLMGEYFAINIPKPCRLTFQSRFLMKTAFT